MVARGLRLTPDGVEWAVVPVRGDRRACSCPPASGPTFRLGVGGPLVSLSELFADLRAGGLTPHPYGADADAEVAARFVGVLAAAGAGAPVLGGATPAYMEDGTPEEQVRPDPTMGVNKGRFPPFDDTETVARYGSFEAAMWDIATIGGGVIRQMDGIDLLWNTLMPATEIPDPPGIIEALTGSGFAAFADVTLMVLASVATGVKLNATLFTWGGGGSLNSAETEPGDPIEDPQNKEEEAPDGLTYGQVEAGKPAHQSNVIIPSVKGWAEWYWDPGPIDADADEMNYQRMGLNVHAGEGASDYMKLCARRKLLGLLAFGDAVGQYLVQMEEVLGRRGLRLKDVFEVLETGNEMEVYWLNDATPEVAADGAHELARFHGALAAAIQWRTSAIPFKVGELAAWGVHKSWEVRLTWLRDAIRRSLPDVTEFLNTVADGWSVFTEYYEDRFSLWATVLDLVLAGVAPVVGAWVLEALIGAERAAYILDHYSAASLIVLALDVGWTPPWAEAGATFVASTLVQEVGFHWFHFSQVAHDEYGGDCPDDPTDDCQLVADADAFVSIVVDAVRDRLGVSLEWSVSAMGYPSNHPQNIKLGKVDEQAAVYTNPRFQASSLVRMTLLLRAIGAKRVLWHTHMSNVSRDYNNPGPDAPPPWLLYTGMGLREDIALSEDEWTMDDGSYLGAHSAVPRPAWFSFRRLVWLLSRTKAVEEVYAAAGVSILKLTANPQGFTSPYHAGLGGYPRAFVFWVDPFASVKFARAYVVWRGETYRTYSLVPDVTPEHPGNVNLDESTAPVDDHGYALPEAVDWGEGDEVGASVGSQSIQLADADIRLGDVTLFKILSVTVKRSKEKTPGLAILFIDGDLLTVEFTPGRPGLGID